VKYKDKNSLGTMKIEGGKVRGAGDGHFFKECKRRFKWNRK